MRGDGIVYATSNSGRTMVGSSYPGGEVPPKGRAVRPLKRYASWVQSDVSQLGLYPVWAF